MKHKDYTLTNQMKKQIEIWINNKTPVSYSEICKKFNWEKEKCNSKKAQIKSLEKNYKFEYVGSHSHKKFLFYENVQKNLITEPLEKRGQYIVLDKIIMERLNLSESGSLKGSSLDIVEQLRLINYNFFYTMYNLDSIKSSLGFPIYFLNSFIDVIRERISKILERSLNRLVTNGYIKLKKEIIIKKFNNKYPKSATEEENKEIEQIRNKTIKELGYKTINEVIKDGRGFEYRKELNRNLRSCGIEYFYENYTIEKNHKGINMIDKREHARLINDFNSLFIKNCILSFRKKVNNFKNNEKYEKLSAETYFQLNKFLVECLLDNNSVFNLKAKTIKDNGIERHCSSLENGYYWTFINNVYGNLYKKIYL